MKYKINEFIKYLGSCDNGYHILITINKPKPVFGRPEYTGNERFCENVDGYSQMYVSVNPCQKMYDKPKISDVLAWTCEYIDLDIKRADSSIPATDKELEILKSEINDINNWLGMNGIMSGYSDFTGNGYRWLLPVPVLDLKGMNVKDVMKLNEQKKEFLRIIERETGANIDVTVGELSRITGIPGTMNVKSHDERDRRREPFRGCDRLEDQNLQDYIMSIEIPETEIDIKQRKFYGSVSDIIKGLMIKDKSLNTMINRATLIKRGHRSGYDYSIAQKLRDLGVGIDDCMDILQQYGTTKVQDRKNYIRITVMNAYTKVI